MARALPAGLAAALLQSGDTGGTGDGAGAGAGLRHVEQAEIRDRSAAAHAAAVEGSEGAQEAFNREHFFEIGVNGWLQALGTHTFPTTLLDLSQEEAQCILDKAAGGDGTVRCREALEEKMQRAIEAHGGTCFVKLSSRSPKDSPLILEKAKRACQEALLGGRAGDADGGKGSDSDGDGEGGDAQVSGAELNRRLCMLADAVILGSAVSSGHEAFELLSHSERVSEDLRFAQEGVREGEAWNVSLVVREFDPRLRAATEFRGFVWSRQLQAVGQYYHSLHFSSLQSEAMQRQILAACQCSFAAFQHRVDFSSYMIDFAVLDPETVVVVELNPFDGTLGSFPASTGLFSWRADKARLTGGEQDNECEEPSLADSDDVTCLELDGTELRVRTRLADVAKLKMELSPAWREIVLPPRHDVASETT